MSAGVREASDVRETAFLAIAEGGREGEIPARHDAIGTYGAVSVHAWCSSRFP